MTKPTMKSELREILEELTCPLDSEHRLSLLESWGKDIDQAITKIEGLIKEYSKCEWCGLNDLVCGKAWKEERDNLRAELAKSREREQWFDNLVEKEIKGKYVSLRDYVEALRSELAQALWKLDKKKGKV